MWSMFSQDFSDFAKAFKSESAGFVDYLGHMASEVVGRGDVYAGDEVLKKATQSMPLPNELVRRLQEAESTYALPIQPEEKEAFAAWLKANPLSSLNAQRRHTADEQQQPRGDGGSPQAPGAVTMTPNRRSTEWPDEPADETRQRLLDYNEVVLQRYMALVGDAVSPRSSIPASPATPDPRRRLVDPSSAAKFDQEEDAANTVKPPPPATRASPSPAKVPSSVAGRVTEDDFFDRYFFRLTQLRVSEAQRRRHVEDAVQDSADISPVAAFAQRGSKDDASLASSAQATPQTNTNDASRQSTAAAEDDFVAVPLFAKRMMTAASGFVTNIDNALNSVVAAETSRCSGEAVDARNINLEDESANVDPSELVHFRGAKQQIADLEAVVHELQETLRQTQRRVRQLTAELEKNHIPVPEEELPSSTQQTPSKAAEATTPERHQDSSPVAAASASAVEGVAAVASSPAAPASASSSPQIKDPVTAVDTPAAAAPASSATKEDAGVISAGSEGEEEEDDEAWVSVNPSAE